MDFVLSHPLVQQANTFTTQNLYFSCTEKYFVDCLLWAFTNFFLWLICCSLEFNYKFLTKLFDNRPAVAHDFFAFFLIHTGAMRNNAFHDALLHGMKIDYGNPTVTLAIEGISAVMAAVGFILIFFSFYRLLI